MAVGETSAVAPPARSCRSAAAPASQGPGDEVVEEAAPLVKEADPELEKLLAEEEEIERRTREHHETPHFRQHGDVTDAMLMPRKVKHRKQQRGRMQGDVEGRHRGRRSASTASRPSSRAGSPPARSRPPVSP